MFKIIDPKGEITTFEGSAAEINEDHPLIKEILKKSDYSKYFFIPNDSDDNKIALSEVFQFQVNVKSVGSFQFIFKSEGFQKDEVIEQVSSLKDLKVDNAESARYKVTALINILKHYEPIFCIFKEDDDTFFYSYEFEPIVNHRFPIFLVRVARNSHIYEFTIGDDEYKEQAHKEEKKTVAIKYSKEKMLKDLKRNKFSLLLVLVSTILLQVSIPLAILNVYSKNALYIFLFICGAIGFAMNTYCYIDYFRNKSIKNPLFMFSVIANFLGIGIGVGIFAIFYHISTKAEGTPNIGSFILIGILISIIVIAATIAIIKFIPRKNKTK